MSKLEFKVIPVEKDENINVIIGQAHFIKTVEDISEIVMESVPNIKYGLAFCEASGPCLVRSNGNDEVLLKLAEKNALNIGAGHSFILFIKEAFPINLLNELKMCSEVCRIFCASANPIQVIVCETEQGRGIIGVIDGSSPQGIENEEDKSQRKDFLRKIGYKF